MKRHRLRFSILAVFALITIAAIIFAAIAARPSPTIRITVLVDGDFTFESETYSQNDLDAVVSDAVAHRKRWLVDPRAQVTFDPKVSFEQVPRVLSLIEQAGCDEVQIGLSPKLSGQLSHPEFNSEPW
ncbi:MAG: hypothetical protein AAGG48_22950 [Planctomycetota bacterium]